jgi:hypothetical protein
MSIGSYEPIIATAEIPDPDWAKVEPFANLLRTGFKGGRLVEDFDHPVVRKLLGQV